MSRSPAELEELVRALEIVWIEQSERAHAFQQEAAGLWRVRAEQDQTIAHLRREIEALRASVSTTLSVASLECPVRATAADDPTLRDRLTRQREAIAQRKGVLASL
ncbi:hypothetical protein GOFOIKOB_6350 [Methylobacterium tardum]|uniref:Uncharacterized protein n=1 Tax=Methylobacterium tardum TaxID=374432 RepID=A0AA37TG06_9HYPH|nr:hypothetical protein [Methylobacterium tardum]URD37944.1 hypothetical protein M6G65_05440 [Methylobacterium tardum]GJE53272.1 hypothetical protein GOFOIKOB_6350 [Methylobacterium tardum]GLS67998.1 hypothetical protein GCM10007890_00090 [Methylobacterium tardum]